MPLTIDVAGHEVSVPMTNFWAFNAPAHSTSRTVSISAESADAKVRFGIAENPLVQFVSATALEVDGTGMRFTVGIDLDEWRFFVARIGIDGGTNLTVGISGYTATNRMENAKTVSQARWKPRRTFERDSRVRFVFAGMNGLGVRVVKSWGLRAYGSSISESLIERMRDQDIEEMKRIGLVTEGE